MSQMDKQTEAKVWGSALYVWNMNWCLDVQVESTQLDRPVQCLRIGQVEITGSLTAVCHYFF
jgi:hypothetical protein